MMSVYRRLFAIGLLAAAGCLIQPQAARATCCNIFTTQSCADCNFFMCNCQHSCDCQNSCETNCNQDFNTCLITCTQRNCNYCTTYFHACMRRCGGTGARRAVPRASTFDLAPPQSHCEEIFGAIDTNSDRLISRREFLAFIRSQPRPRQRDRAYLTSVIGMAVASLDGQNPGKVFSRMDLNHDGYIDRIEAGLDSDGVSRPAGGVRHKLH
jgi:hypothetical protein